MKPEVVKRIDQVQRKSILNSYSETRSGITPANWTPTCLGDIYTERKEPGNESLPLLTVSIHSGVSDGELDEDDLPKKVKRIEDKSQYKRAATGDLVFNMMRAWQGAIGTVRTEGMVSPAYIVAKPNDKVYPPFMDYYMKTPRMVGMINRQSYGVTDFRKRLYWDSFAPIPCILPPVAEQKKLAEILTTQDKAIELQGRKIEELKRFKQGCLKRMFPRKGQKVPEKRFPGFTDDWEQRKLGELALFNPKEELPDVFEYVDLESVVGTEMLSHRTEEKATAPSRAQRLAHTGDLFYQTVRPYQKNNYLFEKPEKNYVFSTGYAQLRPFVDGYFLLSLVQNGQFVKTVLDNCTGTSYPAINANDLAEIEVFSPKNEHEHHQIGEYFRHLDNLITLHQRKLEEMKKQKKALMQLLLTGIVRV